MGVPELPHQGHHGLLTHEQGIVHVFRFRKFPNRLGVVQCDADKLQSLGPKLLLKRDEARDFR